MNLSSAVDIKSVKDYIKKYFLKLLQSDHNKRIIELVCGPGRYVYIT
jgi:hypothetical protein